MKTNANQPSQPSIVEEDQQRVPKSANGTQVKCSKQQLRQQDERLCFHCNLPGHLKRSCPKIPYCSKCRTRGHTQDRCTNKSQRTRHTHQASESRDQQKRNEDLPQFSSHHNKCLQCAGDHQTTRPHDNDKLPPLTVLLVVQVLLYTKMHLTPHAPLFILIHNHQPHTVNLPCMYKHQLLT